MYISTLYSWLTFCCTFSFETILPIIPTNSIVDAMKFFQVLSIMSTLLKNSNKAVLHIHVLPAPDKCHLNETLIEEVSSSECSFYSIHLSLIYFPFNTIQRRKLDDSQIIIIIFPRRGSRLDFANTYKL